jgi:hypothetical protein
MRPTVVGRASLKRLREKTDPLLWDRAAALVPDDALNVAFVLKHADLVVFCDYIPPAPKNAEPRYLFLFDFPETVTWKEILRKPLPEAVPYVGQSKYHVVDGRAFALVTPKRLVVGDVEQVRSYFNRFFLAKDWPAHVPSRDAVDKKDGRPIEELRELPALLKTVDRRKPAWLASTKPGARGRNLGAFLTPLLGPGANGFTSAGKISIESGGESVTLVGEFPSVASATTAEAALRKALAPAKGPDRGLIHAPGLHWLAEQARVVRSESEVRLVLPLAASVKP